jgi:uncharacterized membrane protein
MLSLAHALDPVLAFAPTFAAMDLDYDQLFYRWVHLVAGVMWIGMLYFFNFVNAGFVGTMDADTKKKVVPELMPRALWWFRWGAAFTWLSGVAMAMKLYYSSRAAPIIYASTSEHVGQPMPFSKWFLAFALLLVLYVVYDVIARLTAKKAELGYVIWAAIAIGFGCVLEKYFEFSNRAIYIHIGALFGTAMAANVWMRIWPAQKRIITAVKAGQAPNPADPPLAGLRSKHNTYMSVPLLLLMVSVHQEKLLGASPWQYPIAGVMLIGLIGTYLLYKAVPKVRGF